MKQISLRAARVNAKLTIAEASEKIGVNRDTLSRWERGKTFPDIKQFKSIAKAYKIRYEDIII